VEYEQKVEEWRGMARLAGHPPPKRPSIELPIHLAIYLELQRWHTHQLVAGGLLDQPDWTWDLIMLAGDVWEQSLAEPGDEMKSEVIDLRGRD
jgi:hypothetical protein